MARLTLTSWQREEVLKRLCKAVREAEDRRAVKLRHLQTWRHAYEQDMPKAKPDHPFNAACKVVIPFIRPATDAIADRLGRTTFGVDPFFVVTGQNDRRDDLTAAMIQHGLQWFMQRMRLPARMDRGNALVAKDGVTWAHVRYVHHQGWVKQTVQQQTQQMLLGADGMPMLNALTGEPYSESIDEERKEWVKVTTYKGPEVRALAAEDAGVYPASATSADEVEGYYRMVTRSLAEWRRLEKTGLYQHIADLERSVETRPQRDQMQRKEGIEPSLLNTDDAAPKTAYECIWRWKSKNGPDAWYVFTLSIDPPALLRAEDYWYDHGRPNLVPLRILPRQDSMYGYSIPELCLNLQEEMNALVRQHTDAGTTSNTVTTIGPRMHGLEEQIIEVGRHNYVDDPTSTQIVRFPGPDGTLVQVFGMLDKLGQRLTGSTEISYGSFPGGEVKATEVNAVQAEADVKFTQHLARYQFGSGSLLYGEGLNEVALQVVALMHQYCGDQLARVLGANPFEIVPLADLLSEFDVSAKAVTPKTGMDMEKQTRLAFASVLTGNPLFAQFLMASPKRAHALLEWVAEPHDIHGIDRFIGSAQEAEQQGQGGGMGIPGQEGQPGMPGQQEMPPELAAMMQGVPGAG